MVTGHNPVGVGHGFLFLWNSLFLLKLTLNLLEDIINANKTCIFLTQAGVFSICSFRMVVVRVGFLS